ncbi:MAG: hypothetical protein ACLFVG_08555 [Candidatus Aminicenantes bacterium]
MLKSYAMCRFQSRVDVDYDCTGPNIEALIDHVLSYLIKGEGLPDSEAFCL